MVFSFKNRVYNWVRENKENKKPSSKPSAKLRSQEALADHQEQGQHHHKRYPQKEKAIKEKLKMAELMVAALFIEKKHRGRYQAVGEEFIEVRKFIYRG